MPLTGKMIIGQQQVAGSQEALYALDAASGNRLEPAFGGASEAQLDLACCLAEAAFNPYRALPDGQRADFLDAIGEQVLALGDELITRAMQESGLPRARLEGERMRTVNQLRLFAQVLRAGHWHSAVLDSALPERTPPRPSLSQRHIGIGPVVVFGASNFPLAFSVAGGDTASALAAGCPVVVKAHPAHLGTCELVAKAVQQAAAQTGMPEGVFSLLIGAGNHIGQALVAHPAIQAVGFTGSRQGGLALLATAQARRQPIPVYAEMSSINPVLLLPAALNARGDAIGEAFANSLALGAGQFCTNPGLLLVVKGPALDAFIAKASKAISERAASTMLTPGIHQAYCQGVERLEQHPNSSLLAKGIVAKGPYEAQAALFQVEAEAFMADSLLEQENFGPSSLLVLCRDLAEMASVVASLDGQLTATLQMDEADHPHAAQLLPILERKAGRILVNDFPTGVEVCHAMVHGGPFPSTSDSRTTSVGAAAIARFLRPVCYQNMPQSLLPGALQNANPLGLWRLKDGELSQS